MPTLFGTGDPLPTSRTVKLAHPVIDVGDLQSRARPGALRSYYAGLMRVRQQLHPRQVHSKPNPAWTIR